ncbi:hypothetical protein EIN_031450 [Entamoeba invadens IP1]|uniref:Uncharacterized protein n=1 Tax=Entamoeba invadens IP1 TaxID=370355 RepID=A0A0A1TY83_ENTIV|nr:hypothetical protein EIN_031450 [Entamoeba invadens IP1]ELP86434.1 hypothetical protein EIN_031450 [Entamoeba invadens IP1]|eukprot:XP_004185780.1 hypothetical protein EIN_031450 [Entamoeba invadens IP1]
MNCKYKMSKLSTLAYFQVYNYVPLRFLYSLLFVNKKNRNLISMLTETICEESYLPHIAHTPFLNTLTIQTKNPSLGVKDLSVVKTLSKLQRISIDADITVDQLTQILAPKLTSLSVSFCESGEEANTKFIDTISGQTTLQQLSIAKDFSKHNRFSLTKEVASLSNLQNLTSLKVFCFCSSFTTITTLVALNVFVADSTYFNQHIGEFLACRRLRSLTLRNYFTRFSQIENVTKLTHLTSMDITESEVGSDPLISSLTTMSNLKCLHATLTADAQDLPSFSQTPDYFHFLGDVFVERGLDTTMHIPQGLRLKALNICNEYDGDFTDIAKLFTLGFECLRVLSPTVNIGKVRTLGREVIKDFVLKDVQHIEAPNEFTRFISLSSIDIVNSVVPTEVFQVQHLKRLMLAMVKQIDLQPVSQLVSLESLVLKDIPTCINIGSVTTIPHLFNLTLVNISGDLKPLTLLQKGARLITSKNLIDDALTNSLELKGVVMEQFNEIVEDDISDEVN